MVEKRLLDAAAKEPVQALLDLLAEDPLILDRLLLTCSNKTPLHVATICQDIAFVQEILKWNPQLAEELDSQKSSPLHMASAKGYVEIVKALLSAAPDMYLARDCHGRNPLHLAAMNGRLEILNELIQVAREKVDQGQSILHLADTCLARDCHGRNPLHLAAMNGKLEVLEELIKTCPLAAREKLDRGQTILHLCVKHNQLQVLKNVMQVVNDYGFVNAKDDDGNTILHLAVRDKHVETIQYLTGSNRINVKAENADGHTALEILKLNHLKDENYKDIKHSLRPNFCDSINSQTEPVKLWLAEQRNAIMVVAILIATMAFQAGVTPPGGVWEESSKPGDLEQHEAGESVMAHNQRSVYESFINANTIAFVTSLSTILLLISGLPFQRKLFMWTLMVIMWFTVTSIAVTYALSIAVVTPDFPWRSNIMIGIIGWFSVMTILLVSNTFWLTNRWLKKKQKEGVNVC